MSSFYRIRAMATTAVIAQASLSSPAASLSSSTNLNHAFFRRRTGFIHEARPVAVRMQERGNGGSNTNVYDSCSKPRHHAEGFANCLFKASTGALRRNAVNTLCSNTLLRSGGGMSFSHSGLSWFLRTENSEVLGGGLTRSKFKWIKKAAGYSVAELSMLTTKNYERRVNQITDFVAEARIRATFYPKFENEKSDQEIRMRMIDVVNSNKGVLEVTLKHSGSLFMYAGNMGGAYAKNSYGNLYSAVGVFVLGRTLQEAWGVQAAEKQREFNDYLEKHRLCISMELVTAVLGDHGQRPLTDYVVVTAVTDLKNKPRFYSTPDLIAFCRKWRLPTNHVWLFSSRKSATSFFAAYDALSEEGTATPVSNIMDQLADVSVPGTVSHTEAQGEILEGLVARIVSPQSAVHLQKVLHEFPPAEMKGKKLLKPGLREICAAHKGSEDQQVKALLQGVGRDMCPDWSDWDSKTVDSHLFTKFVNAAPADHMTNKLLEMIQVLRERRMQVRYPCRVKSMEDGRVNFKLTVHVLQDMVFRKYQTEMRRNPGLWPLYRGFFVDVCLTDDGGLTSSKQSISAVTTASQNFSQADIEDDVLADESEHLMLKLKFLTYKIRTFLIRNGLSTLFDQGFPAYRKYYLRQFEIWGTTPNKQQQLDELLTEWAGYITKKYRSKGLEEGTYLSEAEPFLQQFAEQSPRNRRLVGAGGATFRIKDFLTDLATRVEESMAVDPVIAPAAYKPLPTIGYKPISAVGYKPLSEASKTKGVLVFFPGIPGCAKSALCRELLNTPGGFGNGKPLHSLMGDMVKGRYWPKLAEERKKNPSVITLADKNAPNEEVWQTVEDMCQNTSAVGIPVVPDSEGTASNPFSLETLAIFMYRVLQRVDHPGNLDRDSPNAGYVLLMFYNLYEGMDRNEFEGSLKHRFGHLVRQLVLKPDRPEMPPPVIGVLTKGLDLYRRHTVRHGKLDSTKGDFREDWAKWETRLREILFANADHLNAIQVPFEEVVESVQKQLQVIVQGSAPVHTAKEGDHTFHSATYAAVSLPANQIVDILNKVSLLSKEVQRYIFNKGVCASLKAAHITLAHKRSHGAPAVTAFGSSQGVSVQVEFTAFLYNEKMCALEAKFQPNEHDIQSHNEWPHVTVWTAEGTRPKEANTLPQLVSQGQATCLKFPQSFVVSGVVELI